jgi:hypothetical protein
MDLSINRFQYHWAGAWALVCGFQEGISRYNAACLSEEWKRWGGGLKANLKEKCGYFCKCYKSVCVVHIGHGFPFRSPSVEKTDLLPCIEFPVQ